MTGATSYIVATTQKTFVELTESDIQAFRRFQHIFPELVIMLDAGVFEFKGGSVIIHRDADGKLALIVPNWPVYRATRSNQ